MSRFAGFAVLFALLAAARAGHAQQPPCYADRPGDVPWCQGIQLPLRPSEPQTLERRTHVGFLSTGSTLSAGDFQYQMHELGLWNRLGYGLTDRLEIGVDFAFVVAAAGARLQVTDPDSPFKLTVGGGVFTAIGAEGYQGSITAGYHGEDFSIYGSAIGFYDDDGDEADHVFVYTAGIARQFSDRGAVTVYGGRLAAVDDGRREAVHGVGAGYKYMGDRWDIDLSGLVPLMGGDTTVLPVVTFTYRR